MRSAIQQHNRMSGITLVEMMLVITIVGVLSAIALPNFRDSIQSSRVVSASNEIVAAINMARSEAIKSGKGASICPSNNGTSCSGGTNWQTGWIVWTDFNLNGTVDGATGAIPAETVVRYQQALNKMQFTAANVPNNVLSFNSRGVPSALVANPATAITFTMQPQDCTVGRPNVRTLTVLVGGSVKSVRSNCLNQQTP